MMQQSLVEIGGEEDKVFSNAGRVAVGFPKSRPATLRGKVIINYYHLNFIHMMHKVH